VHGRTGESQSNSVMQQDQKTQIPVGSPSADAFQQWVHRAIKEKSASAFLWFLKDTAPNDYTPHLFGTGHALFADAEHKIDLRADWVNAVNALCLALQDWMEDSSAAKTECAALRAGDLLAFFLFRAAIQTLAVLNTVDSQRAHAKRIRDAWEQIERVWSARGVLFHHQLVRNLSSVLQHMEQIHIQRSRKETPDYPTLMADLLKDHAEYLQLPEEKRRSTAFPVPGNRPELNDFTSFLKLSLPHLLTATECQQLCSRFFGVGEWSADYFRSGSGSSPPFHLAARWAESIGAVSTMGLDKISLATLYLSALTPATHANLVENMHITMATLAPDLYVCIRRAWALAAPQPLPRVPTPTPIPSSTTRVNSVIDEKKKSAYAYFKFPVPDPIPAHRFPIYLTFAMGRDVHSQLSTVRQNLQELTPVEVRSFFSLFESGGAAAKEPKTLLETLADDAMAALRKNPEDGLAHARMRAVQDYLEVARGIEEEWRQDGLDLSDPSARLSTLLNAVYLAGPFLEFFFDTQYFLYDDHRRFVALSKHVPARTQLVQLYWATRMQELDRIMRRVVPWANAQQAAWTAMVQKAEAVQGPVKWDDVAAALSLDAKNPAYDVARAAFGLPSEKKSLTLLEQVQESDSFRTHWIELGLWTPSMREAPDKNSIYSFTQLPYSLSYFARLAAFHPEFLYAVTRARGVHQNVPIAAESKESYEQWWTRAVAWLMDHTDRKLQTQWQGSDPYADYTNERFEQLQDRIRMYTAQIKLQKVHAIPKELTSIMEGYVYPKQGGWTAMWSARFARRAVTRKNDQ
jgi:hypothetical protein